MKRTWLGILFGSQDVATIMTGSVWPGHRLRDVSASRNTVINLVSAGSRICRKISSTCTTWTMQGPKDKAYREEKKENYLYHEEYQVWGCFISLGIPFPNCSVCGSLRQQEYHRWVRSLELRTGGGLRLWPYFEQPYSFQNSGILENKKMKLSFFSSLYIYIKIKKRTFTGDEEERLQRLRHLMFQVE